VPTSDSGYIYFSGYFKNTTAGYFRIGKIDLSSWALVDVFDGLSSDFTARLSGFMECGVNSQDKSSDVALLALQVYSDMASSAFYSQFKFWFLKLSVPITTKGFYIPEYTLNSMTANTILV
jgi:hypothetical protein